MNYERLYKELIDKRRSLGKPEGYYETHHIIPRSFGGSNEEDNLIAMTAREHFMAHRFLAKIYPNTGMVHAVFKMACANKTFGRYKVTNRVYEQLRISHAYRVSTDEESKRKKSIAGKGKIQSPEHIKARVESRKKKGDWFSEETRKKIGTANRGKPRPSDKRVSVESVEKRKRTMRETGGWEWTDERRLAASQRLVGKPSKKPPLTEQDKERLREEKSKKVTCPHCGKEGTVLIMPRWHFDNCKKLTQR